jgi:hypothetical protein
MHAPGLSMVPHLPIAVKTVPLKLADCLGIWHVCNGLFMLLLETVPKKQHFFTLGSLSE